MAGIFKNIGKVFLSWLGITLALLVVANIFNFLLGTTNIEYQRSEKLLPIALSMALTMLLFADKRNYLQRIFALGLFYCNIFLILYLTHSHIHFKHICETVALNFCLANFILLLALLVDKFKWKKIIVGISAVICFLPAAVFWFYYFIYQTVFSVDGIIAVMQTNITEAGEYISDHVNLYIWALLIIGVFLYCVLINKLTDLSLKANKYFVVVVMVLSAVSGSITVHNIYRDPIEDFCAIQKSYGDILANKDKRAEAVKANLIFNPQHKGVYILVIGESHNKLYTSLYGYDKDSTPWLRSMQKNPNFIFFNEAYANYSQTVQSLTYALTLKNQYNNLEFKDAPTLLEIAKEAGYKVVWLSNQGKYGIYDIGITMIANSADESYWVNNDQLKIKNNNINDNSYDENILPVLKNIKFTDKMLVIIHLYGNHSKYEARYPKEFDKFKDIKDEGVRTYVNSVYYNDYIMKEIVNYAKNIPDFKGLVYFSDHAEAVNEGEHSATNYKPDMVCIPMYMYFSDSYIKTYPQEIADLRSNADHIFTNDLIANTMLSVMHLRLKNYYEPENDIGSSKYNRDTARFRTLHGKFFITDWRNLKTWE